MRYRKFTLSIGSKEREPFMLDRRLSSGDLLFSTNARPIPEVRLETPDYSTSSERLLPGAAQSRCQRSSVNIP